MFGSLPAAAPGEVMQIDSTPLDVLVLLDDGVPGRVELTGMIDVATRVVPAAVLRPTTKSVDASVLLARALTPEPVRPGWPEALKMPRSVLPYERLLAIDERLEHAAARPVIVPDTIVIDHGRVFVSELPVRRAGTWASHPARPPGQRTGESPHRADSRVGGLAVRPVRLRLYRAQPGLPRPPRRGAAVVVAWPSCRNCSMSGSSRSGRTGRMTGSATRSTRAGRSPRTRSTPRWSRPPATCRSRCGPDDYVELLPAPWQAVNAYGIKVSPAHLRRPGAQPVAPAAVRRQGAQEPVGGPPRPLRHLPDLGPRPLDGLDHRVLEPPAPGRPPFGELAWDHARRSPAARPPRKSSPTRSRPAAPGQPRA